MKVSVSFARLAGLGVAAALTLSASAQTTSVPVTKVWERASSGGSEGWLARVLSVGNEGSEVFTCTGPLIDYRRVFSAHDADPPLELLHDASLEATQRHRVDSAASADVHVSLYDVKAPGPIGNLRDLEVKKYSASTLDWSYDFPVQTNQHENTFVGVSNDGETIVAAAQNIFNGFSFDVAFLRRDYPNGIAVETPVSFTPSGIFHGFDLSSDGSTFAISGTLGIQVGSTATRSITHAFSVPFGDAFKSRITLSGSGKFLAYATDRRVRVFERSNGTYVQVLSYDIPNAPSFETLLDFSDDDSLLACGINYFPDTHQVRVTSIDLTGSNGPSVLHTDLLTGGGSYDDKISDVSVSSNGKRFVVGTWGDDLEAIPEVLVYSTQQAQSIAKVDLPGSVWDLEMAPDGKSFAVGYKHLHANVFASTTTSYALYEIGQRDFRLLGSPRLGNDLEFQLKARAGAPGKVVYGAVDPNYTPADYLGLGIAYVNPTQWSILHLGTGDANNVASRSFSTSAPDLSALAGQTLVFQGLVLSSRRLSRDWVQVTLVP